MGNIAKKIRNGNIIYVHICISIYIYIYVCVCVCVCVCTGNHQFTVSMSMSMYEYENMIKVVYTPMLHTCILHPETAVPTSSVRSPLRLLQIIIQVWIFHLPWWCIKDVAFSVRSIWCFTCMSNISEADSCIHRFESRNKIVGTLVHRDVEVSPNHTFTS